MSQTINETEIYHKSSDLKSIFLFLDMISLYHDALHFWSMDTNINNTSGQVVEASFVTGAANKAIELFHQQKIVNLNNLQNYSVSMWVKVTEDGVLLRMPRLLVNYNSTSGLNIYIKPYDENCTYLLQYKWPRSIFLHMFLNLTDNSSLQLYKNDHLLEPYSKQQTKGCDNVVSTSVELYPDMIYDDLAIWSRPLKRPEVSNIFKRYGKFSYVLGLFDIW